MAPGDAGVRRKKILTGTAALATLLIAGSLFRGKIETLEEEVRTERHEKRTAQKSAEIWKAEAERYERIATRKVRRRKTEEPVFGPDGKFLGFKKTEDEIIDDHVDESRTRELEELRRETESMIVEAFDKGFAKGRKETRPAGKRFSLGFAYGTPGWGPAAGIDSEILGVQLSVTGVVLISTTLEAVTGTGDLGGLALGQLHF